jgi:hypothetical protein
MEQATVLSKASKALPKKALDGFVGQGYGIFAGSQVHWASLRFTEERARWVSRELWHPQQRLSPQEDGHLIMELPFTDGRELAMDILRQGRHVEVLAPPGLRAQVAKELKETLGQYADSGNGVGLGLGQR